MDECKHERVEEMRGIIFCTSCGAEIEKFFGLFKNINVKREPKPLKLQREIESYGFPKDVTKEALKIYKKFYEKNPVRKTIAFGCFCVVWKGNEDKILEKMKLNEKIAQRRLKNVTEKIKNGSW